MGVDPGRVEKREHHRNITDILAPLVDTQQAALADLSAPGIQGLDRSLGRFDTVGFA